MKPQHGEQYIDTILARRSIRRFTPEPVSEAHIDTLLKAAMAAPSAMNRKPWHFVVVTDREKLNALAEAHPFGKMLFEAPLCIAVCGAPSPWPVVRGFWVQDCSAAAENLLLAATALGLGSVWLGVHPVYPRLGRIARGRRLLDIPRNVVLLNLIAIGHPSEEKESRTQYDAARVHRDHW